LKKRESGSGYKLQASTTFGWWYLRVPGGSKI